MHTIILVALSILAALVLLGLIKRLVKLAFFFGLLLVSDVLCTSRRRRGQQQG